MEQGAFYFSLIGLAINLIVTVVGGVWKLSRLELSLREAIAASGREVDERIERQSRYFGETVAAVRQKITEVELFSRDNFVRKSELKLDIEKLDAQLGRIMDKLEER